MTSACVARRSPVCAVLLGAAGLLFARTSSAQPTPGQATPTFRSEVELITVDAVVLDSAGQPVAGLTQDDFVVREEGRPREIVSFEAFVAGAAPGEPAPEVSAVASNTQAAPTAGRAFAIVLDDLGLAAGPVEAARAAAVRFVERYARDADLVTVATTSGDAWWSARIPEGRGDLLAVLARVRGRRVDVPVLERMTEYEAYWIANHEDSPSVSALVPGSSVSLPGRASGSAAEPVAPGSIKERVKQRWQQDNWCQPIYCDSLVRARAAEVEVARATRVRFALACVRRALEALAGLHGRKSLLFLSAGFLQDPASDARLVAAASREANTAVYFVDARGLVALPGYGSAAEQGSLLDPRDRTAIAFEEATVAAAGAVALADETGGFAVRNTNDLSAGAWRVAAESRVFYLLGFHPDESRASRDWRQLRVELKRPGLTVRARRGYSLRSQLAAAAVPASARPAEERRKDGKDGKTGVSPAAVDRLLDAAYDATGIPLRAIAYVLEPRPSDLVRVRLAGELDASALAVEPLGGTVRLELSLVAAQRDGGSAVRQDAALTIAVAAGERPAWRAFTREFDLPPGVSQVRLVVREPSSRVAGSVLQRLEVPYPGELRVSTPILTDRVEPASAAGARPRPALAAHRAFPTGGGLYCQYEVFGAARPQGAPPRVSAGFSLRSRAHGTIRSAPPTPIAADADGRLVRLVGASLAGLEPGAYELVVEVRDESTGERTVRREAFTLEPDGPSPR
jgi:VWFA-related protein